MKILVFGETGQVARKLALRCPEGTQMRFINRAGADLSDPARCGEVIAAARCDAVINAAAWTEVDRAEAEEEAATIVNAAAPAAMAAACALKAVPFLHLSTDYVFPGDGDGAFRPDDPTAPINAYGRSKLAGEKAVRASGGHCLVLRTSWVFSAHGTNFVKTMLRLGRERRSLTVVADQIGGPTYAGEIADALIACARAMAGGQPGGTYHFAGCPETSWAGFARAIMAAAGIECAIEDIASSGYPTPARRPLNSRLDCSSFSRDFGVSRPDWRAGLKETLMQLGAAA